MRSPRLPQAPTHTRYEAIYIPDGVPILVLHTYIPLVHWARPKSMQRLGNWGAHKDTHPHTHITNPPNHPHTLHTSKRVCSIVVVLTVLIFWSSIESLLSIRTFRLSYTVLQSIVKNIIITTGHIAYRISYRISYTSYSA